VCRQKTKVSQKEPDDLVHKLESFGAFLRQIVIENPEVPEGLIINMDETPVFLDMVGNTTMDFRGAREVLMQTTGSEKQRITVALTITSSGEKLPPLIIFKGVDSKNGRILQEFDAREK
jgi:hypothetical protein